MLDYRLKISDIFKNSYSAFVTCRSGSSGSSSSGGGGGRRWK